MNGRESEHPLSVFRPDDRLGQPGWTEVDLPGARPWSLTTGVEHLVDCIRDPARPVITSGEHARHVIEIMDRCVTAAREKRTVPLATAF